MLIELTGEQAGQLMNEIDKLAAYVGDAGASAKTIGVEHVQELVGNNRQYKVFSVIDAMTAGDGAQALSRLDQMLAGEMPKPAVLAIAPRLMKADLTRKEVEGSTV